MRRGLAAKSSPAWRGRGTTKWWRGRLRGAVLTFKRAKRLRREMTLPEVVLWDCLRKGRLSGLQFRRQHPIGSYILDFYCPMARLAIEIDGQGHWRPDQQRHDTARDAWLQSESVRVLRFPATSILDGESLSGVLAEIVDAATG
jgi:very-short-patch-repair endonuclease